MSVDSTKYGEFGKDFDLTNANTLQIFNTMQLLYGELDDKGTSHGNPYTYDTHIPILFYGAGIPAGSSVRKVAITDIAPTVSMILEIPLPSGATGNPLLELFEK